MRELSSFDDLLGRLRAGEEQASYEIFQRFAEPLITKAHFRLDTAIRGKVDAEDVVQSVYRTFFQRIEKGQFELENWESLWGLLVTITIRKCGRKAQHFRTDRRDVSREHNVGIDDSQVPVNWEAIAREPTPDDVAVLAETIDELMNELKDSQRDILTLSLEGYSPTEIAEKIGCNPRTVQRVLKFVKKALEEMQGDVE